ncbi:hypothetical protein PSET11_02225 [Arthrobacter ulcerisalmonis]|uniref:Uncharacterized protein n=1 Tax=Arthrobacter ulcerisalmonis TaxID=2483813 RepID=A0A3P5X4R8_9MICC|nr:hypothetical protein [Arthrobacter ulcerisalmonis]VDC29166.1 hypothetical protein PSET11_02225 [Arthrobacter ulcerisalmonis]
MTSNHFQTTKPFEEAVVIRPEDLRNAARLAVAFRHQDRMGIAALLEDVLSAAAVDKDDRAVTGLILGLGRILGMNVGALDEHTDNAATAGLRHLINEATLTIESRGTK